MSDAEASIGIFDSGVGGLTVFRAIKERLPEESLVYLGDTARVPYGSKSGAAVTRYALACAEVLLKDDVKLLVVACNTASAHALDALREELDLPVLGVIEPGARLAVERTRTGAVGVIGTVSTIRSAAYQDALQALAPRLRVYAKACPLFVPLAEEGWTDGYVPEAIAHAYLDELKESGVDVLVLGCTHYPLLKPIIRDVMGPEVELVDSAETTASAVEATLAGIGLAAPSGNPPSFGYKVTDSPEAFAQVGARFLGHPIDSVEWVDF
ncbi:MAG: glutamate racemase [Candidatus Hydrogenedentota bacterium]